MSDAAVWVISTRAEDSPHPFVDAVYDNEQAAKDHLRELSNNSFKHGVVAWEMHKRTVESDSALKPVSP